MDKLTNMQRTDATFTFVDQEGARAEALRDIIQYINVPDGFEVSLYAVVPGRAVDGCGAAGHRDLRRHAQGQGLVVVDRDRDRVADQVKDFAPVDHLRHPERPLLLARRVPLHRRAQPRAGVPRGRVLLRRSGPGRRRRRGAGRADPARGGELQPHRARLPRGSGRQALHLARPALQRAARRKGRDVRQLGIGGIIRINTDGTGREVYTRGVRNSVGHDFNPATGDLWFTDNQVDGMGDDIPPGELNRQTAAGQHFGFPWTNGAGRDPRIQVGAAARGRGVRRTAARADGACGRSRHELLSRELLPRAVSRRHLLGAARVVEPDDAVGARVMFTALDENGDAAGAEIFADGWLNEETGEYRGRPMDIAFLPDGSMLVSDDFAGAIWRIAYNPASE
jgi:hypothetical protein